VEVRLIDTKVMRANEIKKLNRGNGRGVTC
jgi:hypothetical protein